MPDSLKQKNNFLNHYNKILYFVVIFFVLLALTITLIYSLLTNFYPCIWSSLVSFLFVMITPITNKLISNVLAHITKAKLPKGQIITISMVLFAFKYVFLFLGVIIGCTINLCYDSKIFDILTLVLMASIYPVSVLLTLLIVKKN